MFSGDSWQIVGLSGGGSAGTSPDRTLHIEVFDYDRFGEPDTMALITSDCDATR